MLHHIQRQIRTKPWLGRLALKAIPDIKWHVNINPIGEFAIRLRQNRSYWLRDPLSHEGFMLGALHRLIRSGDVVYDIGANVGLYSRFIIQRFHASHVYAFEPMEGNRSLLAHNLRIGRCVDQTTILPYAVGNHDGTCDFQVDNVSSASGTLDTVTHGEACQARRQYGLPPVVEQVPVRRLDTLLNTTGLVSPDVIKLDIEGAEGLALKGARNLLSDHRPRLAIELHGPGAAHEVLELLWSFGYHCFGNLEKDGLRVYKHLDSADLKYITELYSLQHLVASPIEEGLLQPVQDLVA